MRALSMLLNMLNWFALMLLLLSLTNAKSKKDVLISSINDDEAIDLYYWPPYNNTILSTITIGEVQYNIYDKFKFCLNKCVENEILSYPSNYDYPRIETNITKDEIKRLKPEDKEKINSVINKNSLKKDFAVEDAIGWAYREKEIDTLKSIIIWNSKKTFVILDEKLSNIDFSKGFMKLGRGLEVYSLKNYFNRSRRIYEISSKKIIRVGCLNVLDLDLNHLESFTMIPSYLNNMGGEKVIVQGPCISGQNNGEISLTLNKNKYTSSLTVPLNILNQTDNTFYFIMPLTWHPGIYTFKFKYNGITFETEAEIYSLMDSNYKEMISWKNISEMNNANYNGKYIELTWEGDLDSIEFNLISLPNVEKFSFPELKIIKMGSHDSKSFYIQDIQNLDFDSSKQIGYFTIQSTPDIKSWSKPFSLIWLRAHVSKINKKYAFQEAECTKYFKDQKKQLNSDCPDYSKKTQFLISRFQRLKYPVDFPIYNQEAQECYIEVVASSTGVTCCYSVNGSLIYGQDYYLKNNIIASSYNWVYSPLKDPFNHFFFDQLPMLSCCNFISNNDLCSKYWQLNNINTLNINRDYAGNSFGDPHFIPFNNISIYSFLSRGEYYLLKSMDDKFILQGRFYSIEKSQSILKGIVFSTNSNKIMISTKRNAVISLDWNVLFNAEIVTLPFISKGIFIRQSKDTRKLLINIKIIDKYLVHMEITRYQYVVPFNEYMNLKIFVSNNFQEIIEGGLFGKIENYASSSGLYYYDTKEKVQINANDSEYFKFSKSWQLKKENSLFQYETKETFEIFNEVETFSVMPNFTNSVMNDCENIRFCSIDKTFYSESDFSNITKSIYKERIQYNNNLEEAKYGKKHVCDHPPWNNVKLDSDNYEEGSIINILGCIDPKMTKKNEKQIIQCNSNLEWIATPNINKEFCIKPAESVNLVVVVAVPVVILLLIIIAVVVILSAKRFKKRNVLNSDTSTTSQDPLTASTNVPMDVIYDTWDPNQADQEDQYEVYSHIKKSHNTKTAEINT